MPLLVHLYCADLIPLTMAKPTTSEAGQIFSLVVIVAHLMRVERSVVVVPVTDTKTRLSRYTEIVTVSPLQRSVVVCTSDSSVPVVSR
jgi:hypothetical protein